jgi:hypothetical protein
VWREDVRTHRLERATTRVPATIRQFAQDGAVSDYLVGDEQGPLELHRLDGLQFARAPELTLDGH